MTLSIKSDPARKLPCPTCKRPSVRLISGGGGTTKGDNARRKFFDKYPVVSNRLPFGLELPGVAIKHAGRLGKCVIESRAHERRVYDRIGATRG